MNVKQIQSLCWLAGISLSIVSCVICVAYGLQGLAETGDEVKWLIENDAIPDSVTKYFASGLTMVFAICFLLIARIFFMTREHIKEIEKLKEEYNQKEEQ